MKHLLITTIAAVVLVGCGESQQTTVKAPDISIYDAAWDGNIEAVKQHIAAGTDVNAKNSFGFIPLHLANATPGYGMREGRPSSGSHGHKEIVELLIAEGADVNAKVGEPLQVVHFIEGTSGQFAGKTPLDLATFYGDTETAALLRKHGGKHSTINTAAVGGDIEAVKFFLASGADVNAKDEDGETPLGWAELRNHTEIATLLRKHGGKYGLIAVAAKVGDVEAVREFLAAGADVNAKDEFGGTPLHFAAEEGHKEIAELLIAAGANVNAKNKLGRVVEGEVGGYTPLDLATHPSNPNASPETADLLRKHGGKTGAELKAEGK